MAITSGIISGFDEARRSYRDAELKKAAADQDREFSLLQALATHIDPEIAALGAAGLLNLAGGSPKTGKGLRGFFGEVDRNTALPSLRAFLGAGSANATPQPGSAAQPDTAVVEPERMAQGPGVGSVPPPNMAGAPAPGVGAGVTAPTFGAAEGSPLGAPPGLDMAGGGGMLGMAPPGPPPPETPQQRSNRLFPTAGMIAEDTTFRTLQGRLNAILQAIRAAKSPDEVDVIRGIAGAPRRATATKPMNAEYRTIDGQEMSGTVIFDPDSGQAEVDGQPVTILKMLPTNAPRPIRVNVKGPDGNITAEFRDPNDPNAPPVGSVATGLPPPPPPSPYSGTVTTDEGVWRLGREGGATRLGDAPDRTGLSPEQQEATAWLTDVNTTVKDRLSTANQNRMPGMKITALPVAQQNQIVQTVTGGRYKTIGDLTAATKRAAGGGGTAPADDARSRANRVRQRLENSSPSTVRGPGMPPE